MAFGVGVCICSVAFFVLCRTLAGKEMKSAAQIDTNFSENSSSGNFQKAWVKTNLLWHSNPSRLVCSSFKGGFSYWNVTAKQFTGRRQTVSQNVASLGFITNSAVHAHFDVGLCKNYPWRCSLSSSFSKINFIFVNIFNATCVAVSHWMSNRSYLSQRGQEDRTKNSFGKLFLFHRDVVQLPSFVFA